MPQALAARSTAASDERSTSGSVNAGRLAEFLLADRRTQIRRRPGRSAPPLVAAACEMFSTRSISTLFAVAERLTRAGPYRPLSGCAPVSEVSATLVSSTTRAGRPAGNAVLPRGGKARSTAAGPRGSFLLRRTSACPRISPPPQKTSRRRALAAHSSTASASACSSSAARGCPSASPSPGDSAPPR